MYFLLGAAILLVLVFFLSGIRVVAPTTHGLVERLGKYRRFAKPGFDWIVPVIDRLFRITIIEVVVNVEPQEILMSDRMERGRASRYRAYATAQKSGAFYASIEG
jgi:regulator of protease activity HflC (stomatin/prohibitin superfamily)